MLYSQRDAQGRLVRLEPAPFAGMNGHLEAESAEAKGWFAAQDSLYELQQSDAEMIRVLEDLIDALIAKGVVRLTDLPAPAQEKLVLRSQARDSLGGLTQLVRDDDHIL